MEKSYIYIIIGVLVIISVSIMVVILFQNNKSKPDSEPKINNKKENNNNSDLTVNGTTLLDVNEDFGMYSGSFPSWYQKNTQSENKINPHLTAHSINNPLDTLPQNAYFERFTSPGKKVEFQVPEPKNFIRTSDSEETPIYDS